jgi:hypothetical protein
MPPQTSGSTAPGPERPLASYASVARVARVYDYLLGGKDNFAVDREAAEQAMRIDHDPIVLTHARALLTSAPEGITDYIEADLREPGKILAEAALTLDFSRPVAIMLIAILHLILDRDDPYDLVCQLVNAVAPGSYVVISRGERHRQRRDDQHDQPAQRADGPAERAPDPPRGRILLRRARLARARPGAHP